MNDNRRNKKAKYERGKITQYSNYQQKKQWKENFTRKRDDTNSYIKITLAILPLPQTYNCISTKGFLQTLPTYYCT